MAKILFVIGGGVFTMEPGEEVSKIDRFFIETIAMPKPKICFLPTASGDSPGYIQSFYDAFANFRCAPAHLSLFAPPTADLESFLLEHDAIYVGGGNTLCLLGVWSAWGLGPILRKAWEHGVVLGGVSAGAMCWYAEGLTDSIPGQFSRLPALGFLAGSFCPHYDSEPMRRPALHQYIRQRTLSDGIALDDGLALVYRSGELSSAVTVVPGARAYRVTGIADAVKETEIPTMPLAAR